MKFFEDWVLQPNYLPGWLQALAAIVALGISVYAVRMTGSEERRRVRLELRGILVAIFPELGMLRIDVRSARKRLEFVKEHCARQVGQSVAANVQMGVGISVPPMIDRYTDKLFMFGDVAGPALLSLVRTILNYNQIVEQMTSIMVSQGAHEWPEALSHIERHLDLLELITSKCEQAIRPMYDAIDG